MEHTNSRASNWNGNGRWGPKSVETRRGAVSSRPAIYIMDIAVGKSAYRFPHLATLSLFHSSSILIRWLYVKELLRRDTGPQNAAVVRSPSFSVRALWNLWICIIVSLTQRSNASANSQGLSHFLYTADVYIEQNVCKFTWQKMYRPSWSFFFFKGTEKHLILYSWQRARRVGEKMDQPLVFVGAFS